MHISLIPDDNQYVPWSDFFVRFLSDRVILEWHGGDCFRIPLYTKEKLIFLNTRFTFYKQVTVIYNVSERKKFGVSCAW